MTGRGAGLTVMVLGAVVAVLPAFTWYAVPVAGGAVRASGFAGAGQLLLLPVAGAAAVLAGAALVSSRRDARAATARRTGLVTVAAGLVALGFTVWAAADPRVTLTADLPGGTEVVPATVDVEPAAYIAPVVCALLVVMGVAVAWSGRRR
ncbi:MAG: hypothetical protein AB7V62_01580 [Thermoleophilia bacterium]